MASGGATESQCDLPRNVVKRIVKEKLSSTPGAKPDLQINKEALLAFGESAKVTLVSSCLYKYQQGLVWGWPADRPCCLAPACVQVFISFITATANDVCKERKRATINADDVFQALEDLEFGDLLPALRESYEGGCPCRQGGGMSMRYLIECTWPYANRPKDVMQM